MPDTTGMESPTYKMTLRTFNQIIRRFPALKVPAHASPGQLPEFRNPSYAVRPEGAQELRPFRANEITYGARYPGRCPALTSSAPLARHRGSFYKGETTNRDL